MPFQNSDLAEFSITAVAVPPPLADAGISHAPAVEFYKIDSRKIRLREWLRSTSPLTAMIGWGLKWVGGNLTAAQRAPCGRDWNSLEISGDELPEDVREKFSGRVAELWEAGFRDPVFYRLVNRFNEWSPPPRPEHRRFRRRRLDAVVARDDRDHRQRPFCP